MKATIIGCAFTFPSYPIHLDGFEIRAKSRALTAGAGSVVVEDSPLAAEGATCSVTDISDHVQSCGRRKLLYVAASIPFLLPVQGNGRDLSAAADELSSPLYLLIKEEVRKVLSKAKAAGVLRLVFHDAGTFETKEKSGGMNGSIVYELDRPENQGLKKPLKVDDYVRFLKKPRVRWTQSNQVQVSIFPLNYQGFGSYYHIPALQVSWADMISIAGAEAVSICGGPSITVQLGRIDSMAPDPEGKLPEESLDASGLKESFRRKGFSTQELVALSGAHTLGSKGFGSPITFDNAYYKILLEKPWLSSASMSAMIGLPSDRALADDDECLRWVKTYANNQEVFFQDFHDAFIKLVNSGAQWRKL